eukprot:gi/632979000/ref/XP_007906224.1/ PREDICTED: trans-2,3-enoyl-CoA reductase-like [Callorhinchus milii]
MSAGPLLQDSRVMKNLAVSSIVTMYFRDLGPQLSWTVVFLTEYTGPLFIYLLFYFRLPNLYDVEDINHYSRHSVVHLACICHSIHYAKQLLETLFVHNFSNGNTALKNMLKVCEAGNYFINIALVHMQKTGSGIHFARATYNPFTWLFKLVSCPNYTYEMGTWISFTIMTQTLPVAVFALMISLQLSLWAQRKHFKYRKHFKNYPVYRAAIIPFIL